LELPWLHSRPRRLLQSATTSTIPDNNPRSKQTGTPYRTFNKVENKLPQNMQNQVQPKDKNILESYKTILEDLVENKKYQEAMDIFRTMEIHSTPDVSSYELVASAAVKIGLTGTIILTQKLL